MSAETPGNGLTKLNADALQYLRNGCPEDKKVELVKMGEEMSYYYAGLYSPGMVDESLKQAAMEGFLMALENFDLERSDKFTRFAIHCIISEIRQELRSRKLFKVPDWLNRLQNEVIDATEELSRNSASLPTLKDIANKVNIAEKGITEAMQAGTVSLDDIDFSSFKSIRLDTFKLPLEDVIAIRKSLDRLNNIQRKVLSLININLRELKLAFEEEEQALTKTQARYMRMMLEDGELNNPDQYLSSFMVEFPAEFNEEEVLRYFEVLTDEYGLRLSELEFKGKPRQEDRDHVSVPVDIVLEGRYRGLLELLDYLRNKEAAVKISRVRTTRNEKVPARITTFIKATTCFAINKQN